MNQPMKININGKSYDVEVGDLTSSPVTVTVNGKTYSVEWESASQLAASGESCSGCSSTGCTSGGGCSKTSRSPNTTRGKWGFRK
jgi:hypothetical protein